MCSLLCTSITSSSPHITVEYRLPIMASSVDAKLLKQTKFPPDFNQKVDMKKVNVEVMKKYRYLVHPSRHC